MSMKCLDKDKLSSILYKYINTQDYVYNFDRQALRHISLSLSLSPPPMQVIISWPNKTALLSTQTLISIAKRRMS